MKVGIIRIPNGVGVQVAVEVADSVLVGMAVGVNVTVSNLSRKTTSGKVPSIKSICCLYFSHPSVSTINVAGCPAWEVLTKILAIPFTSVMSSKGAFPPTSIVTLAFGTYSPVSFTCTRTW